jgi:hypothetical protein
MSKKLIKKESAAAANDKFPPFQSRYEAYGMLKSKYEEIKEEIDDIGEGILEDYWNLCRGTDETKNLLYSLESAINCSIQELIQLGTIVHKSKNLEENKNDNRPRVAD